MTDTEIRKENQAAEEAAAETTGEETAAEAAPEAAESAETAEKAEAGTDGSEAEAAESAEAEEEAAPAEEAPQAEAEEEAAGKDEAAEEKKYAGFFKKKEKKDKKDQQIEELNDRLKRQLAEFDNFRKRTEREKAAMYQIGAKEVLEKMLPVIDNFERGFANADMEDPFVDGMSKIYKQMEKILADLGVTPIESVGKEFDPNLHNAVMHVDDDSVGDGIVVEELQKGYMYKDAVLRYSMVKVAN